MLAYGTLTIQTSPTLLQVKSQFITAQFDEVRVRAEKTSSARQSVEFANMTEPDFVAFEILRDPGMVIYLR
jgi:hypothetical protein